jgi:putative membrane protein
MGLPAWSLRPVLRRPAVLATARALTGPLVAFAIYNVVFIGWHFPSMYNWALVNHNAHILQHLMFIGAAVLMWWPVVSPVPELDRIQTPVRMLYLFALGIPMSIVSAIITLAEQAMYPWYTAAPRVFENITAVDDQQLGGLIMWVPGMIVFWTAITIIFFRWSTREQREEWRERAALRAEG